LNDNKDKRKAKNRKKKQLSRISLANLTGAFTVLGIGFLISLLVFLIEKAVFLWKTNRILVV
jgi:ionotropic glutamate receptor